MSDLSRSVTESMLSMQDSLSPMEFFQRYGYFTPEFIVTGDYSNVSTVVVRLGGTTLEVVELKSMYIQIFRTKTVGSSQGRVRATQMFIEVLVNRQSKIGWQVYEV